MPQDIDAAVELARTPAVQARLPDQPTIATQVNASHDLNMDSVTTALNVDEVAMEAALAAHNAAVRALYDSAQSSTGPTPDQYRSAPAPSTPSHPLIQPAPLPLPPVVTSDSPA
jgi:hypothetical protein